jgi:beta-hydroxylase
MGLSHPKASLRTDIAKRLHELASDVVKASPFIDSEKLVSFVTELAIAASPSGSTLEACLSKSMAVLLRPGEVRSGLSRMLDIDSLGNLIATSRSSHAAYHQPSLAKAAHTAAAKVWSSSLSHLCQDDWKNLRTSLHALPLHQLGQQWPDVIATIVGTIATLSLRQKADVSIAKHLPAAIRSSYKLRRFIQIDLLGTKLTSQGFARVLQMAQQVLPHALGAEVQCQVRAKLFAIGREGWTTEAQHEEGGWLTERACKRRRKTYQVAPIELSVPSGCWREESHPSAMSPFLDPRQFPYMFSLIQEFRGELVKEFDRLWRDCQTAFKTWENNQNWRLLGTHLFGSRIEACAEAAPWAAWIADSLGATICGYSVLLPGARIPPHSEDGNSAALRAHVGLRVPCAGGYGLRVEQQIACWSESSLFLFDSTKIHEAWNYSEEIRAVLLLDFGAPPLPSNEWPIWTQTSMAEQVHVLQHMGGASHPAPEDHPPLSKLREFPPGVDVELGHELSLAEPKLTLPAGSRGTVKCSIQPALACPPAFAVSLEDAPGNPIPLPADLLIKLPAEMQRFRAQVSCPTRGYMSQMLYVTCSVAWEGPRIDAWEEASGRLHATYLIQGWQAFRSLGLRDEKCISWQQGGPGEIWSLNFALPEGARQCWDVINSSIASASA